MTFWLSELKVKLRHVLLKADCSKTTEYSGKQTPLFYNKLVMGLGQTFWPGLGWVKFLLLGLGKVSHLWFGFGSHKFPL